MPRTSAPPVRANTSAVCASIPRVREVFSPLSRQPPPSGVAFSCSWPASVPAPGSVTPSAGRTCPLAIPGNQAACWRWLACRTSTSLIKAVRMIR